MADNFVTIRLLESEISTIRHALSDAAFILPMGPTQAACSQALGMVAFADACAHAVPVQQCPDTPPPDTNQEIA